MKPIVNALHPRSGFAPAERWRGSQPVDQACLVAFIEQVMHLCDVVPAMIVNPGFGGQKFLPKMLLKIRKLRRLCKSKGLDSWIEIDGGQNGYSAVLAVEAGADARGSRVRRRHRANSK